MKLKKEMLKMNKLFNKVKNITKRDTKEWYTANMIAPNGTRYRKGVKANNEYEAYGLIAMNMPEGNVIINIAKGN
jgi:hypothetical protein